MSLSHEVPIGRRVRVRAKAVRTPMALKLPPESVVVVRSTGVEFLSSQPLDLFQRLELRLSLSGTDYRAGALVVSCRACSPKVWRIALLFSSPADDIENLSLAA